MTTEEKMREQDPGPVGAEIPPGYLDELLAELDRHQAREPIR